MYQSNEQSIQGKIIEMGIAGKMTTHVNYPIKRQIHDYD